MMTATTLNAIEDSLRARVSGNTDKLLGLSAALHGDPETAFEEHRSAARVAALLEEAGFETRVGCYGLPTAIEATYGSGNLRVAICAEYDALPEIGHACGHNIIASAAVGAALALAEAAQELDLTVVVLGTPAEENGGGKVIMLEAGAFDSIDFSLMVHPAPRIDVDCIGTSSQGCDRFEVVFGGKASHAAAAPSHGVNAANAATLAQVAIGLLRQQLPDGIRINTIVSDAGSALNVIAESSRVEVEVRAHDAAIQNNVKDKVLRTFEGAALATGCTWSWNQTTPAYLPLVQNESILRHWNRGIESTGRTLVSVQPGSSGGGSTDMGNVSQVLPAIHPVIGVLDAEGMPHTAAFAAATNGPGADAAVLDAATAMALAVAGVASDANLRAALKEESARRRTEV